MKSLKKILKIIVDQKLIKENDDLNSLYNLCKQMGYEKNLKQFQDELVGLLIAEIQELRTIDELELENVSGGSGKFSKKLASTVLSILGLTGGVAPSTGAHLVKEGTTLPSSIKSDKILSGAKKIIEDHPTAVGAAGGSSILAIPTMMLIPRIKKALKLIQHDGESGGNAETKLKYLEDELNWDRDKIENFKEQINGILLGCNKFNTIKIEDQEKGIDINGQMRNPYDVAIEGIDEHFKLAECQEFLKNFASREEFEKLNDLVSELNSLKPSKTGDFDQEKFLTGKDLVFKIQSILHDIFEERHVELNKRIKSLDLYKYIGDIRIQACSSMGDLKAKEDANKEMTAADELVKLRNELIEIGANDKITSDLFESIKEAEGDVSKFDAITKKIRDKKTNYRNDEAVKLIKSINGSLKNLNHSNNKVIRDEAISSIVNKISRKKEILNGLRSNYNKLDAIESSLVENLGSIKKELNKKITEEEDALRTEIDSTKRLIGNCLNYNIRLFNQVSTYIKDKRAINSNAQRNRNWLISSVRNSLFDKDKLKPISAFPKLMQNDLRLIEPFINLLKIMDNKYDTEFYSDFIEFKKKEGLCLNFLLKEYFETAIDLSTLQKFGKDIKSLLGDNKQTQDETITKIKGLYENTN